MIRKLKKQLHRRIMVMDGAMGTMLYAKGIFINRCFDELNLSMPQVVKEIHQEYIFEDDSHKFAHENDSA